MKKWKKLMRKKRKPLAELHLKSEKAKKSEAVFGGICKKQRKCSCL